ncbi:MAG: hypothetical protein HYV07_08445 [Deltaproteobacteria bacterium]|nr:hypothetical protein [Deltaproteobacteria bacterium]
MPTKVTGKITDKVRRDVQGGARGRGHEFQERLQKVSRPDPRKIAAGPADPKLTGFAGLLAFGIFLRRTGVDRELHESFDRLKVGPRTVYRVGDQIRLLVDANVVGESRVLGIEACAADPLFLQLAGGPFRVSIQCIGIWSVSMTRESPLSSRCPQSTA